MGDKLGTTKTNALTDALEATRQNVGQRCGIRLILDQLDDADAATVTEWFRQPSISGAHIGRALTHAGHRVSTDSIGRHRRGECRCET